MRAVYLSRYALIMLLLLAIWNVGLTQDSLGMSCVSSLIYWPYVNNFQMEGDLAYVVAASSGLHIMDLSDPVNPVEIANYTWLEWGQGGGNVYVTGDRAYIGMSTGGIVLDVSDSTHPVELGHWTSTIGSSISYVHDYWAIAQDRENRPYVLDLSDPTNVHYIGGFPDFDAWIAVGMAGEYLCMTGNPGGLVFFDMSNPAEPHRVSSIDTTMRAHYAVISENYAYLATLNHGLRIIDLSNPLQPVEVAVCDTIGHTWDVTVTGSYAITMKYSDLGNCLNIWNVTDPIHPVLESTIYPQSLQLGIIASSGDLVCAKGEIPYNMVLVVNISNPSVPVEISSFGPSGGFTRHIVSGSTAYLADFIIGLRVVDITDPRHLFELTHINTCLAEGFDVAIRGNYAFALENTYGSSACSLVTYDVSNPTQPESLGCEIAQGGRQIVLAGDYAYVAGVNDLYTYHLANPADPQCVDVLDLPASTSYLGLVELYGYLYYGAWSTLYVYSLSNPAAPELVCSRNLSGIGCVFNLAATGRNIYVADGHGGMRIVDVGDPINPTEINWIDGYWVGTVAAVENTVIMDDRTRISIYDVTNPYNPTLEGYYSTYENISDMEIQGQYLYTTSESEFRVYQCDALNPVAPIEEITPHDFALHPCYPNPFNSNLVIPFTLPMQTDATITIYNILGQQVHQFEPTPLSPGTHQVLWNAGSLSSGVYIVQMSANGVTYRQKSVLLK